MLSLARISDGFPLFAFLAIILFAGVVYYFAARR